MGKLRKLKRSIKRKYMKNAIAEYKKAKKAGSTGKVTYTTGLNIFDKVADPPPFLDSIIKTG